MFGYSCSDTQRVMSLRAVSAASVVDGMLPNSWVIECELSRRKVLLSGAQNSRFTSFNVFIRRINVVLRRSKLKMSSGNCYVTNQSNRVSKRHTLPLLTSKTVGVRTYR